MNRAPRLTRILPFTCQNIGLIPIYVLCAKSNHRQTNAAMPYHVFRHLSAITAVIPKPNDVTGAYQISWWLTPQAPWNERKAGGRGREGGHAGRMEGGRGREGMRVQWRAGGRGRAGAREEGAEKGGREGEGVEGGGGRREGGREGWGRGGRRKFYLRAELIKCIDPNEGEALKRGWEGERAGGREGGREGWGRGGRRKFYLRAELIKCIDPNEGEALKRGGREGKGEAEGRQKILPGGRIDQMY